ncbi:uncharacterized protein LOC143293889 isoform X7 [Babylonia areolata]|uniref:uncharacterized protein LOC143293889 isoform X7 n=1 Tax=Babylonia areolata TaxID=304850 RepID=UPI003FD0A806
MSQYCTTNATLPTTNHKTAFHSCFQATVTVKKTGDLVNIKMDGDKASRFVSSLVKSIQALCNGYIDFSSSIEVIGHIHLNIDRSVKLDYVLTEEVSKSVSEGSTLFASHSYHSQPPSKSDSSSRNRQKQSAGVSQGDEGDSTFRSSSSEVHNTSSKSDSHSHRRSHYGENSVSSHTGSFVDTSDSVLVKQEHRQNMCQSQESLDRRRRNAPSQPQSHRSSSPAAKRSRQSDCNPEQDQNFEVIEIKEEPEDEPAVFFGNSSSHMAAGQDVQTPDFSNVVMESLDRVGQVEGTNLVASGDGGQMQQQPFPVMMHANSGMSSSSASSSAPGPLLSDPQSLASTSGMGQSYERCVSELGPQVQQLQNSMELDGYASAPFYTQERWHKVRNPRSSYWRNMSEERRALEREKSRLRMQASRARRKERERLLAETGRTFSPCV